MNHEYALTISDKQQLKQLYMPFIKEGAVFIPTEDELSLNTSIRLKLKIPEESETFLVEGPVIWLNPALAQNGRSQGVGIRFQNKEAKRLKVKIEQLITGIKLDNKKSETL